MGWFQNILQKFLDFLALFLILIIPSLYLVHLIISLIIQFVNPISCWFCLVLKSLINTIFQNLVFIIFYSKNLFCFAHFILTLILILNLNFYYYLIKLNLETSIETECLTLRIKIKMKMMKKILWYNLQTVIQINFLR